MTQFKDHFSGLSQDYARYRPTYPPELFQWLAETAPANTHAWDCATGAGQAACMLAEHFEAVTATDASANQLAAAQPHPRVTYHTAPAERCGLPDKSVDLITVAQAIHWFHFNAFYAEVRRVAKPGALLVAVSYGFFTVDETVDGLIDTYANKLLGPYWPPERAYVDARYTTLPFPFPQIDAPVFTMHDTWPLARVLGYLTTWSAYKNYRAAHGDNPLDQVREQLIEAWGQAPRHITWPLTLIAGRV